MDSWMLSGGWKCPKRSVAAHSVAMLPVGAACAKPGLPGDVCSLERLEMWDPTMWDTAGLCLEYTGGFELCKGRGGQSDDGGGHL